jgi:hypothetical protein
MVMENHVRKYNRDSLKKVNNHGDQLKVVVTCNQTLLNRIKFQLILHDDHGLQFWDLVEGYDLLRRIMSKNDKWETIVTNV